MLTMPSILRLCSTIIFLIPASAIAAAPATTSSGVIAPSVVSKHDNSLPIEISSETLEVLQAENKAIFRGNVIAVQGDFRLKSDTMIVHYKQKQDDKTAASTSAPAPATTKVAAQNASAPDSMGSITLIEVEGNVLMATPEESARGEKGDYHTDSRILHLFGKNVVLTKGKNILRGTALEYNMNTGRSLLTHEGESQDKGDAGRVRGVFVPQKTDNNSKAPATAPQPTNSPASDQPPTMSK